MQERCNEQRNIVNLSLFNFNDELKNIKWNYYRMKIFVCLIHNSMHKNIIFIINSQQDFNVFKDEETNNFSIAKNGSKIAFIIVVVGVVCQWR